MPGVKQPILIGVYGKARSGKDTVSDYLCGRMHLRKYAFAEPLKQMLKSVFGPYFHDGDRERICPEAGVSYRVLMQTLGTEWGRAINPDLWVNLVEKHWNWLKEMAPTHSPRCDGMILSDVRFDSEAAWIKAQGGVIIEVTRPGTEQVGVSGHASEAGIKPGFINATVVNDGDLAKLYTTVDSLVKDYLSRM